MSRIFVAVSNSAPKNDSWCIKLSWWDDKSCWNQDIYIRQESAYFTTEENKACESERIKLLAIITGEKKKDVFWMGGGEVHHAQDFRRVFILEYDVFWIEKYFFFHYNKVFQCFPIDDDPLFFSSEFLKERKTFIRKEIPF